MEMKRIEATAEAIAALKMGISNRGENLPDDLWMQAFLQAKAALEAALGDEFVIVPKTPSDEMLVTGDNYARNNDSKAGIWWLRNIYKAMIAAYTSNEANDG